MKGWKSWAAPAVNFLTTRSWRKQPLPLPWPSACVWAAQGFHHGPLMCVAQFLSHGLLPCMLPNHSARAFCLWNDHSHPLPWQCLCQGMLVVHACYTVCHGVLPVHAVQLLCNSSLPLRATQPRGAMALCSCELPRPSGPLNCLITLCGSRVMPSPSFTSRHYHCELPSPSPTQCCCYFS